MKTIFFIFILVACYNFSFAQSDSVYVQMVGDTVKILNVGASENCCISVITSTVISNDSIIIVEHDTSTSYCHCTCTFDFSVNLTNLAPGKYLVLVYRKYTFFTPDSLYFIDSTSFQYDVEATGDFKSVAYQSPCYTPVSVEEKLENDPTQTILSQNYPNPFNPITTISFSLPEDAQVTLKLYNMLGQEVAIVLDKQEMERGEHEFDFDAGNYPSGLYFYRLTAGNYINVKKMVLLK
jgi:hypothetical protein